MTSSIAENKNSIGYCAYPWQQMIVDLTGEVVPCCFWSGYGNTGKPLGNTNINTIDEIWNNENYQALRKANFSRNLEGHPCKQCVAYSWANGNYPPFSSPISWRRESGFCYIFEIPDSFINIIEEVIDQVVLLENGVPLPYSDSQHDDIRSIGMGRYSVWGSYLYFSTSDNSDPATNERSYELSSSLGSIILPALVTDSLSGKNILKANEEYFNGVEIMSAKPTMISLVSTADCNIDCPGCSQNMVRLVRVQHRAETVPDILEHVPYLHQFIWHGGEPYLIKRFRQFIDEFCIENNPNLTFGFTSNGTMLNSKELEKLEKFPRINASISIDSFNKKTFEKIRKGADFEKVLTNVLRAISVYNSPYRVFTVGMIVCKSNFLELPENLEFAIENDIGLNLSPVVIYPVTEQINVFENYELQTKGWQEALDRAKSIIEKAKLNNKKAMRRVDPSGMLDTLQSILNENALLLSKCRQIAIQVHDPSNSLRKMKYPGMFLYDENVNKILAYCKLASSSGAYYMYLPKGHMISHITWVLAHNLFELHGRVAADWLASSYKIKLSIPKFIGVSRHKNSYYANYGEVTSDGLNVHGPEDISVAYYKITEKERATIDISKSVHGFHYKIYLKSINFIRKLVNFLKISKI